MSLHDEQMSLVSSWLQNVEHAPSDLPGTARLVDRLPIVDSDDNYNSDRPTKRTCRHHSGDADFSFEQPFAWPSSPPMTMSGDASTKRGADELNRVPVMPIVRPILRPVSPTRSQGSRSDSPSKTGGTSPTRGNKREVLQRFTRPVEPRKLKAAELPKDLTKLYSSLQRDRHKQGVIPAEVQEQVIRDEGEDEALPYMFRAPVVGTDGTEEARVAAKASAMAQFEVLAGIVDEAEIAVQQGYNESDWNCLVHVAVLKTVFRSRPPPPNTSVTQARVVCSMAAGILADYMPTIQQPNRIHAADFNAEGTRTPTAASTEAKVRGSGHKKVDFLLSMETGKGTGLHNVLRDVAGGQVTKNARTPWINHTDHEPVQYAPIAASIETKVPTGSDSSLQLGTWVSAWHNRMIAHRAFLGTEYPELIKDEPALPVPSSLLIEVVGHRWSLYFACDGENAIHLFGPMDIGGTQRLTDIYSLVAALTTIKDWIEGGFREKLEEWFIRKKLDALLRWDEA